LPFFFGAAIGAIVVLPNKVVTCHPLAAIRQV